MNKARFNHLVKDYSNLDSEEKDLDNLIMEYPYSQPVRMLNVKSSSGLSKKEYQQRIALAAFYTTDRNVLRSLIEKGKVPSDFGERPAKPITHQQVPRAKKPEKPKAKPLMKRVEPEAKPQIAKSVIKDNKPIDAGHLREDVLANLKILQETKASFLKLVEPDGKAVKSIEKSVTIKASTTRQVAKKQATKPKASAAKAMLEKGSKSPRVKKNELIDKFIADEPSITPGKAVKENQSDLSKASSELKEDLVSENLAIIFAKQGKASKAIEIYKKLIWKFPQKKASFAARIEELKKK